MYDLGFRHLRRIVSKTIRTTRTISARGHHLAFNRATQKRKVKQVINRIDLFHAIDRLSIMDEIENVSSTH